MVAAALVIAQEGAEAVNELPISPIMFGVLGFTALVSLLLVTYAFRSVGTRH
ncbi:hypothetical protein [Paraoerskovia marina]|uniref:Uncharacterized protein n=1 Tax=Paraoerskovia marina TaxID=545619 RepID=A0A1H1RMY7_9CELL|nr:hypothetical protein [Paraoerskovia marina]SDS37064.1 hypothetical protein SAMN04489860_1399 [Paraoerskovia marina]